MKIVKKLKGIISWHFYKDDEMKSIIDLIMDFTDGKTDSSIPVLTNLFKGSTGDEIAEFFIISGQDENRLYIDNEQKKLILNIKYDDLETVIKTMESFLKDKRTPMKEIVRIMISKKEYSLQGFNQQYKRYLRIANKKKEKENKVNNPEGVNTQNVNTETNGADSN